MSVYHFENGKLVKIYDTLSQAIDEDRECNPEEGFASADFTMPGEVEDMASTLPVLDRDELNEYVDALRLMEPLLAPKTFLELESEIFHRIEEEVRREQAPDL